MAEERSSSKDTFGVPYVGIAVFCEKVLKEGDGVMSLIRVVDRVTFAVAAGPTPQAYPLFAVVMLKSGDAQGTQAVGLRSIGPSGQQLGTFEAPALFEGNDRGVSVVVQFPFQPAEEGLHWFDVLVDGQQFTRMPLRAVYQRLSVTGPWTGVGNVNTPDAPVVTWIDSAISDQATE